jgi:hypothetical protein
MLQALSQQVGKLKLNHCLLDFTHTIVQLVCLCSSCQALDGLDFSCTCIHSTMWRVQVAVSIFQARTPWLEAWHSVVTATAR